MGFVALVVTSLIMPIIRTILLRRGVLGTAGIIEVRTWGVCHVGAGFGMGLGGGMTV